MIFSTWVLCAHMPSAWNYSWIKNVTACSSVARGRHVGTCCLQLQDMSHTLEDMVLKLATTVTSWSYIHFSFETLLHLMLHTFVNCCEAWCTVLQHYHVFKSPQFSSQLSLVVGPFSGADLCPSSTLFLGLNCLTYHLHKPHSKITEDYSNATPILN